MSETKKHKTYLIGPKALQKKPAHTDKVDSSRKILPWGVNNDFPQRLLETINASPVGKACVETIVDFIQGDGLADAELAKAKINKRHTFSDLHRKLSGDLGRLKGFAVVVQYNHELKKAQFQYIPVKYCRLGEPDSTGWVSEIIYNPYYGVNQSEDKRSEDVIYPVYDPSPEVVSNQIKRLGNDFKGQIFFYGDEGAYDDDDYYPYPNYWGDYKGGGNKWFKIDAKIANFHERNISNNFLQSILLKMIGDPDEEIITGKNADGTDQVTTVGESFDEAMNDSFSGDDNGGKVMVLWSKVKEEFPEITQFPTNSNHELFLALQTLTTDQISIATKVPRILANIATAGKLGDSQEFKNATRYMQKTVKSEQQILEDTYRELITGSVFTGFKDFNIRNSNVPDEIPDNVWNVLTVEEKRKWIKKNYSIELDEQDLLNKSGNTTV